MPKELLDAVTTVATSLAQASEGWNNIRLEASLELLSQQPPLPTNDTHVLLRIASGVLKA